MIYNLGRSLDNIIRKRMKVGMEEEVEEGIKKGKIEIAEKMLKKGFEIEDIIEITGLEKTQVLRVMEKIDIIKN